MTKEFIFESAIAPYIEGFIEEKHLQGYKYFNGTKWMKKFDEYWIAHGYGKTGLTIENLDQWRQKRDCEGTNCQTARITVVRQFSVYLNGLGIPSYFLPIDARCTKPLIHVLCDEEISALFNEIDSYYPQKGSVDTRRMSVMYPVLFRLIYCCGLRISEACNLPASNTDLANGMVTILDGKGNRDRLIHLSEDLKQLCIRYFGHLCNDLGEKPVCFFPGIDKNKPISDGTVRQRFDACWNQTAYAAQCNRKPTVHSLRHAYVVKRLNLWMKQCLDLDHMIPYLSRFLGHKSFNETLYYYHFVEEAAQIIKQKDMTIDRVIPEVIRR